MVNAAGEAEEEDEEAEKEEEEELPDDFLIIGQGACVVLKGQKAKYRMTSCKEVC
jgi:hypothetical protein